LVKAFALYGIKGFHNWIMGYNFFLYHLLFFV
jgi:hypothetical protein